MTGPLTTRLRAATAAAHERIETALNLFGPGFCVERYARLLERWHGFESAWQAVAPVTLASAVPAEFCERRRKLHLLQADLTALGRTPAAVAALPAVPPNALPWNTLAGAMGVLYVAEGSTLGGQHVAKTVHAKVGLTPDHGVTYFSSYGPTVGVRWRETKAVLDAQPDALADEIVAGANATFDYLTTWLAETSGVTPAAVR